MLRLKILFLELFKIFDKLWVLYMKYCLKSKTTFIPKYYFQTETNKKNNFLTIVSKILIHLLLFIIYK